MPRQRRCRFTRRKANALLPGRPVAKLPCCVVCYNEFTPYPLTCNSWEASMGKVFYKVLNIPQSQTNGDMDIDNIEGEEGVEDDEDDSIISLPFCAQCHSKVSVMFSLYNQLLFAQEQFCSVRNDVAFTVVETISKNCRNGPMDFIRQQICQQWQTAYNDAKEKNEMGLGVMHQGSDRLYFDDSKIDIVPSGAMKILQEPIGAATEIVEHRKTQVTVPHARPPSPTDYLDDSDVPDPDPDTDTSAIVVNNGPKRRPHSPIPAMPKLIPMAKLQAEAQRNQIKQSPVSRLTNSSLTTGKLTTKPVPSLTSGYQRIGNGTVLLQKQDRGLKTMTAGGRGLNKAKKTDSKRSRNKKESSDESFEGLTTKDIILKQNSLLMAEEEELHQCKLCPRQYSSQGRLLRHESVCHPNLKALRCHICHKGFSSSLTLRRHMQNIHHSAIEGYTMCPLCDRSFIKKHAFQVHLKGHAEQGLAIPPLSPSEMPRAPTGGKRSASAPAHRQITKKASSKKRVTGKTVNRSRKPSVYPQVIANSKSNRTGRTLKMSARAKASAASKFVPKLVPASKTNSFGKTIVSNSNSIAKSAPKLNNKLTQKTIILNSKGRTGNLTPVAVKRKVSANVAIAVGGQAPKRVKASALVNNEDGEEEAVEDGDSEGGNPGLGIDDTSDSDYDP